MTGTIGDRGPTRIGLRPLVAVATVLLVVAMTSCAQALPWVAEPSGGFAPQGLVAVPVPALPRAASTARKAPVPLNGDAEPVSLDLGPIALSAPAFNPSVDRITMTATIGAPAGVTGFIVPASGGAAVRSLAGESTQNQVTLQWDGRDGYGNLAPPGDYRLRLEARDRAGNHALVTSEPLTLTNKRIVVSLGQEMLVAYDGEEAVMRTPVTTGGPDLPTMPGTFHILDKTSPLNVYSPWPKGSPYWFPDVTYRYALEFFENPQLGLYIHDASWRKNFGPGSNVDRGTPGLDDTGTHGCINVPLAAQEALYAWSLVGVPVIIQA